METSTDAPKRALRWKRKVNHKGLCSIPPAVRDALGLFDEVIFEAVTVDTIIIRAPRDGE